MVRRSYHTKRKRSRSRSKSKTKRKLVVEYNSDRMFKFKPEQAQSDILKSHNGSGEISANNKDFVSQISEDSKGSSLSVGLSLTSQRYSDLSSSQQALDPKLDTKDIQKPLLNFIERLISNLSQIRNKNPKVSKEKAYSSLIDFVSKCEQLDLDFDILVGAKLAKYLHVAYLLLLEINDSSSIGYRLVLPRLSKLRELCKKKISTFVNFLLKIVLKRFFERSARPG